MRLLTQKRLVKILSLIALLILSALSTVGREKQSAEVRVVDGDTLKLTSGEYVRLIGVDTPEIHESDKLEADARRSKQDRQTIRDLGRQSKKFLEDLIGNHPIRLEYNQDKQDKYGRGLAYVYLEDDTFVNAEIIKQGYGFAYTSFPFEYRDEFRTWEREAREQKRGLWADDAMNQLKPKSRR